jgi:ABC-2 type transport system ATP-binding protein
VLLEESRMPPFLSVRQVLETVCAVRGLGRARGKDELDRIVHACGIGELLARRAGVLSKGQARKVGLAAALVADPRLLVLDEPSAGLDVAVRIKFEQMLRTLNDGKRTVLIASHLLGEVETACTHLAIVVGGRVVLKGRTQELLERAGAGGRSQVHVPAASSAELDRLGLRYQVSRHPGLLLVHSERTDQELLTLLVQAGVVPKLVEPPANLASFYLDIVASQGDKSRREAGGKG